MIQKLISSRLSFVSIVLPSKFLVQSIDWHSDNKREDTMLVLFETPAGYTLFKVIHVILMVYL
jgi:NOP5NT (NUC127) domain